MLFENPRTNVLDTNLSFEQRSFRKADALWTECQQWPTEVVLSNKYNLPLPRKVAAFSNEAQHVFLAHRTFVSTDKLPYSLECLLFDINKEWNEDFNTVLMEKYCNETNRKGPHYDRTDYRGNKCVVTLNLGWPRHIIMKKRFDHLPIQKFPLAHGQMMIFANDLQDNYTRCLPNEVVSCSKNIVLTFLKVPILRWKNSKLRIFVSRPCLVCKRNTKEISGVCSVCYLKEDFQCPKCKKPVGAPWPCTDCWLKPNSPTPSLSEEEEAPTP